MRKRSFNLEGTHNDPRQHWTISQTFVMPDGRMINAGDDVEISDARGRHTFLKHVVTASAEWLDFVGSGEHGVFRSFKADRVRKIFAKQLDTIN